MDNEKTDRYEYLVFKRLIFIQIILVGFSILASAQFTESRLMIEEPDSTSAMYDLCKAERNFAKASAISGRKKAFIDNFADTSVFFIGHWVKNGRQVQIESNDEPIFLKWEPEFMDISESRDFGISYGPWERQEYRPYTEAISNGYYFTVWELNNEGVWKVTLDCGIITPKYYSYNHSFTFPKGADKPINHYKSVDVNTTCNILEELDEKINKDWDENKDFDEYKKYFSSSFKMLKGYHLPSSDADSIKIWVKSELSNSWMFKGSGAAKSADIGYTYGVKTNNGEPIPWGYYVRVWRKQKDGSWKMILELS